MADRRIVIEEAEVVDPPGRVHVLALCESLFVVLKPNRLYRFQVVDGCAKCREMATQTSN